MIRSPLVAAASSIEIQYLDGMPLWCQWIAISGRTPMASARGRIPPKAAMISACEPSIRVMHNDFMS